MSPSEGGFGTNALDRTRVLLVEDDALDRLAIRQYLSESGPAYELTEAATVREARDLLAAGHFDILLADTRLPDGSGNELLRDAGEAPVVFMAAGDDMPSAANAVRGGTVEYLVKHPGRSFLKGMLLSLGRAAHGQRTRSLLRQSELLCQQVFDESPLGMILVSPTGAILKTNRSACVLLGYEPPEIAMGGLGMVLSRSGIEVFMAVFERLIGGEKSRVHLEMTCDTKGGRELRLVLQVALVKGASGRPLAFLVHLRDVTEDRRMEGALRASAAQLDHSRAMEAIGTLSGGIAHEFNNLLTSILGNLQLAEADVGAEHTIRPLLEDAVGSCRRAGDLVARMLAFTHQAQKPRTPTHLAQVVAEAEPLLRLHLPPDAGIRLAIDGACPPVQCSPGDVIAMILQLGSNSGRAMRGRSGLLELSLAHGLPNSEIRARFPQVGPHHTVCLCVRDSGVGLSPSRLAGLFEPMNAPRWLEEGGLGLASVQGVMRRHRGAVAVESVQGIGTAVRLYFPEAGPPERPDSQGAR